MVRIIDDANNLVNKDKQLVNLSGHNPILEAIGEIFSQVTTGSAIGTIAGGAVGSAVGGVGAAPGAKIGSIIGGIGGLLYGGYDYFASGRSDIDRSAYEAPLSENRFENYANAIKSRQSYKDFRRRQIEDQQEDLLWWQKNAPVSDHYRYMESAGKGNYIYYNLPGIVGSSFSDTKHMGQ